MLDALPGKAAVMAQILGPLPLMWKTWMEHLISVWLSLGCDSHLGSKTAGGRHLSLLLSPSNKYTVFKIGGCESKCPDPCRERKDSSLSYFEPCLCECGHKKTSNNSPGSVVSSLFNEEI